MPSYVGRPIDLAHHGALIRMHVCAPQYIVNESGVIVPPIDITAGIDTGAALTMIVAGIPQRLGLTPIGMMTIASVTSKSHLCKLYHVRLLFPQGVDVDVSAVEVPIENVGVDCLIGRDVLKHSLLIYNGMTNMFSLIF